MQQELNNGTCCMGYYVIYYIKTLFTKETNINDFIQKFADLFNDTDASEIQASTKFHELEEWSSLIGMGCIAMARTQFGKAITGVELKACVTSRRCFQPN